ncbi:MAG: nicotinamide mononucleotide transporter [Paludibacteraceae bacterium]|nr:nicotinamide mononucleotide transporter [Paludibacteraceae bacterium]
MLSKRFDIGFLVSGLIVQVVVYWLAPTHWLSLVSGLLGITSVILCSQGNIWTFAFGFGQILTYSGLCWMERFYAGLLMNAFYFLSQIYGIYAWQRQRTGDSVVIVPRSLQLNRFVLLCTIVAVVSVGVGWLLSRYTDDSQPYLDAVTTVVSIVAQVMLVMAIRQQWWLWLFVDVLFVAMWIMAGNWSMVAQYGFWCINCVYGMLRWKDLATA